eukprot:TRINITY_DN11515_c0_g6_i1.p1 TRINITY_DN11515_c0_g6~~TRINITY_DN11515_c0_g6_i1.p1  ORF type:complete len:563 (-),score=78.15 TRINITY_DN11515_c0_g6_i1:437-2125(-)
MGASTSATEVCCSPSVERQNQDNDISFVHAAYSPHGSYDGDDQLFMNGSDTPLEVLRSLLVTENDDDDDPDFSDDFVDHLRLLPVDLQQAWMALAVQSIRSSIDYRELGLGYIHPETRSQYREARHPSFKAEASLRRAEESRRYLQSLLKDILDQAEQGISNTQVVQFLEASLVTTFLREIGSPKVPNATLYGVIAALKAELLLPLRALNEGQVCVQKTHYGEPVPSNLIAEAVQALLDAVLSKPNGFAEWRYTNPVGQEQLRGLSPKQLGLWRCPTSYTHFDGLHTHEDKESELGFFWATKIGGPSHGFDFEAQCLLPLLCNARNKVILVSDPMWPGYPVGRCHWRLLWAAPSNASLAPGSPSSRSASPQRHPSFRSIGSADSANSSPSSLSGPRLWLEALNGDAEALRAGLGQNWLPAVIKHAVLKSNDMGVPLLVDPELFGILSTEAEHFGGKVQRTCERLVLRPSNGVVEASDWLSSRHDWVQLQEEITEPLLRVMYTPPGQPSSPASVVTTELRCLSRGGSAPGSPVRKDSSFTSPIIAAVPAVVPGSPQRLSPNRR